MIYLASNITILDTTITNCINAISVRYGSYFFTLDSCNIRNSTTGIYSASSNNGQILNSLFENNGYAIYFQLSEFRVNNVNIYRSRNTAIYLYDSQFNGHNLRVGDCGLGAFATDGLNSFATISGGEFFNNSADTDGSNFLIKGGQLELENCTVRGGRTPLRGAIAGLNGAKIFTNNVTISDHSADLGGTVYLAQSSLLMQRSEISRNNLISGETAPTYGGGMYSVDSTVQLYHTSILNNYAFYGGGLYLSSSSVLLVNCHILNNNAKADGGGLLLNNSLTLPAVVNFTVVDGNQAMGVGGGVLVLNAKLESKSLTVTHNIAAAMGSGIHLNNGDCILSEFIVANNSRYSGIEARSSTLKLLGGLIANHQATSGGGLSCTSSTIYASGIEFRNNTASKGGGLAATSTNLEIYHSKFWNNGASESGGGVLFSGGNFYGEYLDMHNNIASSSTGGGIYSTGTSSIFFFQYFDINLF